MPVGARSEAQVHVLGEQVDARVERAERRSVSVWPPARPRPPSRRCAACGPVGLGAVPERARQQRRVTSAGRKAPSVPGSGWALRWTLPSWLSSRGACSAGVLRSRASRERLAVEPIDVRVQQHRHRLGDALEARGCWPRRSRGCRGGRSPRRRASRASSAPPSSGPTSTTTSCAGASVRQEPRELVARAVQHDDDGEAGHGERVAVQAGAAESRTSKCSSARRRAAARRVGVGQDRAERGDRRLGVAGRVEAPAPSGTISSGPPRRGRDDRPARGQRLDQHHAVGLGVGAVQQDVGVGERGAARRRPGRRSSPGPPSRPRSRRSRASSAPSSPGSVAPAIVTRSSGIRVGDLERQLRPLPADERAEHERVRRALGGSGAGRSASRSTPGCSTVASRAELAGDRVRGGRDAVRVARSRP